MNLYFEDDDLKLTKCIPIRTAKIKKTDNTVHLIYKKCKSLAFLMEIQIGKTTLEKILAVPTTVKWALWT